MNRSRSKLRGVLQLGGSGLERALRVRGRAAAAIAAGGADVQQKLLGFCAAPHGREGSRISTICLETLPDCDLRATRRFLAAAHAHGLRVELLYCDADWQPAHSEAARQVCARWIESFSAAVGLSQRFDGIHLDLGDSGHWSQTEFRQLLSDLRAGLDECNQSGTHHMTLAADLGFWWTEGGDNSKPQFADALRWCDYVVSLACRDTAGAQASCAVPQALAAARHGVGFHVGVQTKWLVDQDAVTYYEEGWEHLERELAKLPALIADLGGQLAGVAIDDYDSYLRMRREPRVSPFPDVRLDYWAAHHIVAAYAARIIGGYPGGRYNPAQPVSREQMAVFLTHALLGPDNIPAGPPEPSFADVPPDHWAYRWVECARAHQLMLGNEQGLFGPQEVVNRAEMAVFLARSVVKPTGEAGLACYHPPDRPTFRDVGPDTEWRWCARHVEYLAARGIVGGYPDGLYHPELPCSRDQIAVYLVNALELPLDI